MFLLTLGLTGALTFSWLVIYLAVLWARHRTREQTMRRLRRYDRVRTEKGEEGIVVENKKDGFVLVRIKGRLVSKAENNLTKVKGE